MPAIDHLVYASPDLDDGVQRIERLTGARAVAGGVHDGLGTHNALLGFDSATYFEIIGIDPDQPEPEWGRPFGLVADAPSGLVAYAIHPVDRESLEDVVAAMGALGFDPGGIVPMTRRAPTGEEVSWRLTFPSDPATSGDGSLPFVIDWGRTPSPALSLPSMGSLDSLRVRHPDAAVRDAVAALGLGIDTVQGPPGLVAVVHTPAGPVEIV